jgi:hypothetical protein
MFGLCERCDGPERAMCHYCETSVEKDSLRTWDDEQACEECYGRCVSCGSRVTVEGWRVCVRCN